VSVAQAVQAPAVRSTPRRGFLRLFLYLALFCGLAFLAVAAAVAGYEFRHARHIYPGISLVVPTTQGPLTIELGGLTRAEAPDRLERILTPYPGPHTILRHGDRTWAFSASDLGVELDAAATVEAAFAQGRSGELWADLLRQFELYRRGGTITPVLRYDEGQEAYILGRIAREVNRAPREGVLRLEGLKVVAARGEAGLQMDIAASRAALHEHLVRGGDAEVELVVRAVHPVLEEVDEAAAQVQRLLQGPISLTFKDGQEEVQITITPERLAQWIILRQEARTDGRARLVAEVDEDKVRAYVATELAAQLTREPRDGTFSFDPETKVLTPVTISRNGWRLNVAETAQRIVAAALGDQRQVTPVVDIIRPEIATEDADKMGIKELVAQGTTSFAGSSKERVQNIVAATSKFQNIIIPPGGIFSFNKYLGEVTKENGFAEGLVIWGDRTAVGIGGGICQVSTTAFRAAFWGGFPIIERWAHGYVVSWYGEPGLDATIYTPDVDFKFRNDTSAYLLIQAEADTKTGKLTFNFYGTKPDRTVEIVERKVENVQPPPPPIYQEDPSLKPGEKKQVDWAKEGKDVTIKRVVKQGDKVLYQDVFVSKYKPWAAVYLVGPQTPIPTPTPTPTLTPQPTPTPTTAGG
jgi:vancomycin resistance protein YoaR